MKQSLLHHTEGNRRLILIFAGWSTGPELYTDVRREGWDAMVCYDYTDLEFDSAAIDGYDTIYLYAWSLGVYIASLVLDSPRIAAAFAINGTLQPIDDIKGIPTNIYEGTSRTLNEPNLKKFRMRMFGGARAYAGFAGTFGHDDIDNLRSQLDFIQQLSQNKAVAKGIKWTRAYISDADLIFPPDNQRNAWEGTADIHIIKGAHYLPIQQVVEQTVIDCSEVERRFIESRATYNHNAVAQRLIASQLVDLWKECGLADGCKVLEVGCGTGMFTELYAPMMPNADATFIDICETSAFNLFPKETYIKGDAQIWLQNNAEQKWDYIVSSSAIQWLPDVEHFFANCAKTLNDNGMLVMSSFVKGNMPELEPLGPVRLNYNTSDELEEMLSRSFEKVSVTEGEERVWFSSPMQLLRHVVLTGVGAARSGVSAAKIRRLISTMATDETGRYPLTYKPVYMIASKPRR